MNNLKNLGVVLFILFLCTYAFVYVNTLKNNNQKLENSLMQMQKEVAEVNYSFLICKTELNRQNKKINLFKIDAQKAKKKLNLWKNKPEKVRYKVLYKIREVQSNVCKDIKNTLSYVRNLDYTSL